MFFISSWRKQRHVLWWVIFIFCTMLQWFFVKKTMGWSELKWWRVWKTLFPFEDDGFGFFPPSCSGVYGCHICNMYIIPTNCGFLRPSWPKLSCHAWCGTWSNTRYVAFIGNPPKIPETFRFRNYTKICPDRDATKKSTASFNTEKKKSHAVEAGSWSVDELVDQ